MRESHNSSIKSLDEVDDYQIADGDPDVRGWDVVSADGERIGEVEDLHVDTDAMKVRYLEVAAEGSSRTESGHRVLLPIGYATLHRDDGVVVMERLDRKSIEAIPTWEGGPVTREYETRIRQALDSDYQPDSSTYGGEREEGRYYDHPHYRDEAFRGVLSEEQLEVSKSRKEGRVDVKKRVEHEHVRESVPVTHEEVTVERRPAREGQSSKTEFREDEIRIPVMEEEVVTHKRTVPKEEVVIRKHKVTEEQVVEGDLRKERVEVERSETGPGSKEGGKKGTRDASSGPGRRGPTDPDKR